MNLSGQIVSQTLQGQANTLPNLAIVALLDLLSAATAERG